MLWEHYIWSFPNIMGMLLLTFSECSKTNINIYKMLEKRPTETFQEKSPMHNV